jgi:siroheme synthase-like protein
VSYRGFPIELKLQGKAVAVVGLGRVGRRKAAALVAAGARVVGVDPVLQDLEPAVPEDVEVRAEPYEPGHLQGMSLVIAAGPSELNRRVVSDARRLGVWVCSVSEPDDGDFSLPAVWSSGPLVLTVSTSGASPALAAALRDRAAEALGPAAAGLAALLAELRPVVLRRVDDPDTRRRIFRNWADPRWLALWTEEGPDRVRDAFMQCLLSEGGGRPRLENGSP